MKLIINDKLIKRNKLIGQIGTFGSMAILVLGLVLAFSKDTSKILWSYLALILGFITSQVGMYFSSRFARSPRYDEVFTASFDKLRHQYSFYVFSSPASMLLLGPCGFWIPIPITVGGKVSFENGKWKRQGGNFLSKVLGQESLGRPEAEAATDRLALQKYLVQKGIPEDEIPPIRHLMVVIMKNTELGDVSTSEIPVVQLEELKRYVRREDRDEFSTPISPELNARLVSALEEYKKKA